MAEAVVETWERVLSSGEGTDVTIVCRGSAGAGGCGGGSSSSTCTGGEGSQAPASAAADAAELRAHAAVLRSASKVVRAMLSPAFLEGSTARVELNFDRSAVRLLLAVIYTGEEPDDGCEAASLEDLLSAAELAHQWDVGHAVSALEAAAGKRLEAAHFGHAAEVAARLQLPQLAAACVAFAKHSADVKRDFKASEFSPAVQAVLAKVFDYGPESTAESAKRKRRRVVLG